MEGWTKNVMSATVMSEVRTIQTNAAHPRGVASRAGPPDPARGMPSRQRRGEASLGPHGPVGACQSSPAHRASPRTLLRRRTRPAQSPARLHPGAFLARIATACIAARGRARPPPAAGARARAEPARPPRATHRPSACRSARRRPQPHVHVS